MCKRDVLYDLQAASVAIDMFAEKLREDDMEDYKWRSFREWTNSLHLSVRLMLQSLRTNLNSIQGDNYYDN